jgi:hypothetical protein
VVFPEGKLFIYYFGFVLVLILISNATFIIIVSFVSFVIAIIFVFIVSIVASSSASLSALSSSASSLAPLFLSCDLVHPRAKSILLAITMSS